MRDLSIEKPWYATRRRLVHLVVILMKAPINKNKPATAFLRTLDEANTGSYVIIILAKPITYLLSSFVTDVTP